MAYEIEWADSAVADLLDAIEYIAHDSPSYAAALAVRAERVASSLAEMPHRGRVVPEHRVNAVREVIVDSYRLIYRIDDMKVSVIAFVHIARDLARLMSD